MSASSNLPAVPEDSIAHHSSESLLSPAADAAAPDGLPAPAAAEEMKDALSEVEQRVAELSAIIESIPDAVFIGNEHGITRCNAHVLQLLGFETLEELNAHFHELGERIEMRDAVTGERIPPADEPFARALRGEHVEQEIVVRRRNSGRDFVLRCAAAPVRYRGQIVGAVVINTDITEVRRAEAAKEALLAAVAHDLKNPLAAISGIVQVLQRRAAAGNLPPDRLQSWLSIISTSVARMTVQLNELMDVARFSQGQPLALDWRPTDLVALAQRVAAAQQQSTDIHTIRVEASEPNLVGNWDATRLERVIDNLLTNAVKYSPNGGDIVVTVRREPPVLGRRRGAPRAVLSVRDPGIGIPAEDLPRVFERFYRGANVQLVSGTGIGLSAARQIVEQHGGTISVKSREGAGSTFTVTLPLEDGPSN
ncbi:MAG: PAS domain-containing sensor histidine kinase [Chloroflexi bacterium]|nr:PAS domain-containing sensor histidine kinase [Chloroflexota bacterium]